MKQKLLLKSMLLLFALIAGSSSVWAAEVTGTINFGSADGSTKIQGASSSGEGTVTYTDTGNDSQGNTWTITTVSSTGKSFTQNASYSQVGAAKKPATSITFTTTLPSSQTIKAFSAKFGGFDGTAGDVTLKVGDTSVGTGTLNGTSDVTVSATNTTTAGTVLTVTVTNIAKGVKCYYISYTYESSGLSSNATFANKTPSVNWPTNTTYTQAATTAAGYTGAVTYAIGGTNTCEATINASTGEVSFTKGGTVVVNATAEEVAGQFTQSSDSYTLTVNDVRTAATLSWSENSVEIFKDAASYTLPTLNNPNSLDVTYTVEGTTGLASVTSAGVVTVNTGTVGTATVKASFAGNNSYKPKTATYTINVVDPTVKGSKYNPYTVADVEGQATATTFGNDIYVTGYIVGSVSSNKCYKTKTSSLVDTNLLLADSPDISFSEGADVNSNSDGMIPVELPSGTIRTNWGPKSNNVIGYKVLLKGNALAYFSTNAIKGTSEISAVSIPITPAKTYTTLTSKYNLDFTGLGLEAYIVKDNDLSDNAVTMTQVNKVPANTGLVLVKTSGTTFNVPVFDGTGADDVTGNLMAGSATTTTTVAANAGYILKDGAFHPSSGANALPAGKAYLAISASAPILNLDFGGETTGINAVNGSEFKVNGEYYNLAGQRVTNPTKGLYIVNGKKVIIK